MIKNRMSFATKDELRFSISMFLLQGQIWKVSKSKNRYYKTNPECL